MKSVKIAVKTTLRLQRKGEDAVTVVWPHSKGMTDAQFIEIVKANKAVGTEVFSFNTEYKTQMVITSKSEMLRAGDDMTVENMSRMGE